MLLQAFRRSTLLCITLTLIGLAAPSPSWAQDKGGIFHQLNFPLGTLGARGEVVREQRTLRLTHVRVGAPAHAAGLRVGDVITGVRGRQFPPHSPLPRERSGPVETIGLAIDWASGHGQNTLPLDVRRNGETTRVEVELPAIGSFSSTYPYDCPKTDLIYDELCKEIAQSFRSNQRLHNVTKSLMALTLLGHREGKYDNIVGNYVRQRAEHNLKISDYGAAGTWIWVMMYDGIMMCEYYMAHQDPKILQAINHLAREFSENVPHHGRYGHRIGRLPYGGSGLNATTTGVLWFFASALRCGVDPDIVQQGFEKSLEQIQASTTPNGGVSYGTPAGEQQAALRSGQTGLALYELSQNPSFAQNMGTALQRYGYRTGTWGSRQSNELLEAHATASLGLIASMNALCAWDTNKYIELMQDWRWYFALSWEPTGQPRRGADRTGVGVFDYHVAYIGGKGVYLGDRYLNGGFDLMDPQADSPIMTATVGLIFAASHQRLSFFGGLDAVPGVDYHAISDRQLKDAYQSIRKREYSDAFIALSAVIEKSQRALENAENRNAPENTPDPAAVERANDLRIAQHMFDTLYQERIAPQIAEMENLIASGDLYQADLMSQDLARRYRRIDLITEKINALIDQGLASDEQKAVIEIGRKYYRLEEVALRNPRRYLDHVQKFIDDTEHAFYLQKARALQQRLQDMDTP